MRAWMTGDGDVRSDERYVWEPEVYLQKQTQKIYNNKKKSIRWRSFERSHFYNYCYLHRQDHEGKTIFKHLSLRCHETRSIIANFPVAFKFHIVTPLN